MNLYIILYQIGVENLKQDLFDPASKNFCAYDKPYCIPVNHTFVYYGN